MAERDGPIPILQMSRRAVGWTAAIAIGVWSAFTVASLVLPFPTWMQVAFIGTLAWGLAKCLWGLAHPPILIAQDPRHAGSFVLRGLNTLGVFHKTVVGPSDRLMVGDSAPYGHHLEALGAGRPLAAVSRRLGIYVTPVEVADGRKYFVIGERNDVTPDEVSAAVMKARRP